MSLSKYYFRDELIAKIKDELFKNELFNCYEINLNYEQGIFHIADMLGIDAVGMLHVESVKDVPEKYYRNVKKIDKKQILADLESGTTINGIKKTIKEI